ncbi:MAG: alkaline phosphatase D family protein [Caldilineales bacterium]|nr:alkaline phosphatase D family protein [Caldilineales bacterium]
MKRLIVPLLAFLVAVMVYGVTVVGANGGGEPATALSTVHLPLLLRAGPRPQFSEGVASGDATGAGATLWTRGGSEVTLALEVAASADFGQLVFTTPVTLTAAADFTAQVRANGLASGQRYFYRWRWGRLASPTGSFSTAPLPAQAAPVRFAFSGDTDGALVEGQPGINEFQALAAIRADQPDFFVYLGDTVYADSFLRPSGPAQTLADYRALYRLNRSYPALRDLLASVSTVAIWDDHEVINDFAGQTVDPGRYAIGRQAFGEYLPVNQSDLPADGACAGPPLFRLFHWGSEVDVIVLDLRSCRSADASPLCLDQNGIEDSAPTLPSAGRLQLGLSPIPPFGCREAIADSSRTLLGAAQKAAFKQALASSSATFKFVISEVPIQQYYLGPYDRWEGYGAERAEILNFIRDQGIAGVIFLSGDAHMNLMNDVYLDKFTDPAPIAYEAITGPVAALTLEEALTRFIGPGAVGQMHAALDLIGVDCRHLDAYSYGLVEVEGGQATITLKNDAGQTISDQRTPAVSCTRTFGP